MFILKNISKKNKFKQINIPIYIPPDIHLVLPYISSNSGDHCVVAASARTNKSSSSSKVIPASTAKGASGEDAVLRCLFLELMAWLLESIKSKRNT